MHFIADFHIHSHYSRATAKDLNLINIEHWAFTKGLFVVGTGDFTHPAWFDEIKSSLKEKEEGLFVLNSSNEKRVRFILSAEISCIYTKDKKTRKLHHLILMPDFDAVEKFNSILEKIGNLSADGRPILGLDSKDLLEIVLSVSEMAVLIPAHIWTPWFSLFGSRSGFDTIEECFEDLSKYIFALETGLSSDPPMNWRLSALDRYTLISNSDAHSCSKLAREANLFDIELSYFNIIEAMRTKKGFLGTVEFFPEEGKYHFDGHRKCKVRLNPKETKALSGICPVCKRPVTVGVMHRVESLADREDGFVPNGAPPFRSLLSLSEIISQAFEVGVNSKKVKETYEILLNNLGSELSILMDHDPSDISRYSSPLIGYGIEKMRKRDLIIKPGYDGEFGKIELFTDYERKNFSSQRSFLQVVNDRLKIKEEKKEIFEKKEESNNDILPKKLELFDISKIEPAQEEAISHYGEPMMVIAGPGTGKTYTLVNRIAYLINNGIANPKNILAVTFTNKAAEEMISRINALVKDFNNFSNITITTFHGFAYSLLKEFKNLLIITPEEKDELIRSIGIKYFKKIDSFMVKRIDDALNKLKRNLISYEDNRFKDLLKNFDQEFINSFIPFYPEYQDRLRELGLFDFDDLIIEVIKKMEDDQRWLKDLRTRYTFISVDEFQDINLAQYKMVNLLAPTGENLFVIGDPLQSIYGFRGGSPEFFERFKRDYPGAKVIKFTRSYRSNETILRVSEDIISKGKDGIKPGLISGIKGERLIKIIRFPNEKEEANFIAKTIEEYVGGINLFSIDKGNFFYENENQSWDFSDFAIFYRIHQLGDAVENALFRYGIPYQRLASSSDDIKPFFSLIFGWLRLLIVEPSQIYFFDFLKKKTKMLGGKMPNDPLSFINFLKNKKVSEQIEALIDNLDLKIPDKKIKELLNISSPFEMDTASFLIFMANRDETDKYEARAKKVTLSTLHSAKGLEFSMVFIIGLENGLIPYLPDKGRFFDIEEERRLLYVGITRAKRVVILTHVKERFYFGKKHLFLPSPFLKDIKDYRIKHIQYSTKKKKQESQLKFF
ncbi:MAG: UvrD-helicase domain-containing protein [Deltaproteobacteria bacterium]|nr:UvrD-helicase domain-containing protein [Deltaproteobacteria bacterium]